MDSVPVLLEAEDSEGGREERERAALHDGKSGKNDIESEIYKFHLV
jgi:hypothetical protein